MNVTPPSAGALTQLMPAGWEEAKLNFAQAAVFSRPFPSRFSQRYKLRLDPRWSALSGHQSYVAIATLVDKKLTN